MKYKKIILIILAIICFGIIFAFSSQNSSESLGLSNKLIIKTYETIHGCTLNNKEQKEIIKKYNYIVRKSAHFIIYFILGIIIIQLLSCFNINNKYKLILFSILICFIYAITDEFHQSFTGRSARVLDVFIDTLGATVGLILNYLLFIRKKVIKK